MDANFIQNKNYKTKHCLEYHSPKGCDLGVNCPYVHDINFQGKIPPFMNIPNLIIGPSQLKNIIVPPLLANKPFPIPPIPPIIQP